MSTPQDGGNPPAEGAARKKRRRRRSRKRQGAGNEAQNRAKDGRIADDPGIRPTGTLPAPANASQQTGGLHKKPRKRRRGKRKPKIQNEQDMRNLRPPVAPTPAARFEPVDTAKAPEMAEDNVQRQFRGERQSRYPGKYRRELFAALDLGTNNCRLLMAAPREPGRFKVVDSFSRIIRLGEGLTVTGRLGEEAMERAIEALTICAAKMRSRSLAGQRLIATEACRRAANGEAFLKAVRERTGLELEIVDRETEARLAAVGCGALMDRQADGAVLFDIGGGSSELVLVNRRASKSRWISRQIAGWTSLPLGVVTLAERHGGKEVSRALFDVMIDEVLGHLERFEKRHELAEIWGNGRTHLLGTSGTVTTIAGVHLGLARYDRRKVDGIWLSDRQIDAVVDRLLDLDYESRSRNPCIGKERADLVLAGCAILQAIRRTWPSDRLRVADRGLREGMLNELMHKSGVWSKPGRRRRHGDQRQGNPQDGTARSEAL